MAGSRAKPTVTADDLLALPDGDRFELVDGELRERYVNANSSWIGGRFYWHLHAYAEQSGGLAFPPGIRVRAFPWNWNLVRKADAAYVPKGRLEGDRPPTRGYLEAAPSVAVEVVSPLDLAQDLQRKVRQYLAIGVRLVWVAYPATRTIHVYRPDGTATVLDDTARLSGEAALPGFAVDVAQLLPPA